MEAILSEKKFSDEFFNVTNGWSWEVEGFVDKNGFVYPIDTDTKVISTVFERISSPALRSIAKKYGYVVEIANQTTYPDFTITKYLDGKPLHRIAIDIKTTYKSKSMLFTLGGYNSFLRNNTKNILYPYTTYSEHWIIGFIYEQREGFKEYDLDSMPIRGQINCPYGNVHVFVRNKYQITGIRAGSGNTKNIGSIKLNTPKEFDSANGPFCQFQNGKDACDFYWKNYEKYVMEISSVYDLLSHTDFQQFK
jgi:hypothetical protein